MRRALTRVNAREHVTFGGCLEEGAKGRIARMIIKSGKGGDHRDFARIADWARHIGVAVDGRSAPNPARPGPNRAARPLPRGRRFSEPGGRGTTPARETEEAAARRGETAEMEKETER